MPTRRQPTRDLTPAEWEIMKVFWERGDLAARDVFASLPNSNAWAYKTVKTLLSASLPKERSSTRPLGTLTCIERSCNVMT